MKELEVIVDFRPSPDSPELILVKQKLAADGGELRLVGPPSESRLDMTKRKVRLTVSKLTTHEVGDVLLAHVHNVSLVPFRITRVAFEYEREDPQDSSTEFPSLNGGLQEAGRSLDFVPRDRNRTGPLQPGETRDWYLPSNSRTPVAGVNYRCLSTPVS